MANKNRNLFIILSILIIPLAMYFVLKTSAEENLGSFAEASASKPVVLDFTSPLCLECKELKKVLEPAEKKYHDKITFKKINVNSTAGNTQSLVKKYNVNVVPTMVFLNKEGKVVKRTEGSMPKAELESYLDKLVKNG